ncbi:MAG: prolipoprotein diacylglyceryl transferase [Eubacteriales bacterium]|nr:prolipoprotein diacylglyceryl transferase [Eubacteriales bacterium]
MNNPSRVAFTLFGRDVYWYGVLMALGILIGVWLTLREGKRKKLTEDDILDMCLVIIPSGVVGARLYYVIFEWASYASNPIRALYIWEGGLAIYGAVIGGLIGMFIYSRVKKIRFLKLADCIAPGLVLAQAIGRWGNFFNQEAFGLPINNGELMWFPFAVYIEGYHTFNGQPCSNPYHMATFFYESVWCLIVFIILWSCRRKFKHNGDAILSYAALYGLERMFVERLRGDSLYIIKPGGSIAAGVRVSEMLSFILVVAIAAFFLIRYFKEKKLGRLIWPAPEDEPEEGTTADEAGNAEDCEKEETSEAAEEKPEPEETDQGDSTEDGQ